MAFSVFAFASWAQSTHTIDFEPAGVGADWEWVATEIAPDFNIISNPVSSGINTSATVVEFTAYTTDRNWALCYTDDDGGFTFDASNSTVKIMVNKPVISPVGIKFEGPNGNFEINIPNTVTDQWEEIVYDFSEKIGIGYSRVVIIPDNIPWLVNGFDRTEDVTFYFDNIQVPDGTVAPPLPEPTTVPPIPSQLAENVLSIYTEVYPNLEGTNFNPFWGQSTQVTVDYVAAGNNTLKYANLDYQGTEFTNQDVSGYEFIHVDFWTPNSTVLDFFLISSGPGEEIAYALPITAESWVSVDIPLSSFVPPVDLTDAFQFKVFGNGTVYFDNWYFWRNPVNPVADATLSDLLVDGETVDGFSPSTLNYTVELPFGTTEVPTVTAETNNTNATYQINAATTLPGTTDVVVTSEDETNTLTYSIEFTIAELSPTSDYCETEVWHFNDPIHVSSAIYLTITNVDATSMFIEIESADDDPVDLLQVNTSSGGTPSNPNTSIPGKISRTLTWAGAPPTDVGLTILWSKESQPGNSMLLPFTVPFEASCSGGSNSVTFNPQNGATDVEVSVNPAITFSPAIEMADGSAITNADIANLISFKETDASGADVPFVGSINAGKNVITIDPAAELDGGQVYYFALNDEVVRYLDIEGDLIPGQSISFTTVAGVKPYLALNVQDNFEDDGWATIDDWFFQDPDMLPLPVVEDPVDPANHVADYNRSGNFAYANAQFILDHRMDLTQRNIFEMKVYFPSSNDYSGALAQTAAIKIQNSLLGGSAWETQTEVVQTVTVFDQWVTLEFDFGAAFDRDDYDQVVVQLGGEGHDVPGQFYFDDIELLPIQTGLVADFSGTPTSGFTPLTVQFTDLSTGGPQTWQWDFDNDGVIDSNEQNPSFTYTEPGSYNVYLKIGYLFSPGEDIEEKDDYIAVSDLVIPSYVYNDYDDNQNHIFEGWPNMPEAVVNPDPSGNNTSTNVGQWARSTEQYANIFTIADYTVNFSEGSIFTLQAYAPFACEVLFKLENTSTSESAQRFATVSSADEWQLLAFDFSGEQSDLYDEIIIFFDFGNNVDNVFYFDDIRGPEPNGVPLYKPLLALDVQDNFEDDGYATIDQWYFQDPDLVPLVIVEDPENAANHVADYNRSGTFEWTNAQFILEHRMDLSERNQFEMDVYFPSSNNYFGGLPNTAAVKLQNSLLGGEAYTTQTEIVITVVEYDQWVTLLFDFSAIADSVNYDQAVVQLGGEGHFVPGQFYFDDFVLLGVQMPYMQTVVLSEGWSGISSYVVPSNSNIEDMLGPIIEDVEIIVGPTGFYYPANGTNTLGDWDSQSGYILKMSNASQLEISGNELVDLNLTIPSGWSALPVLSACAISIEDLFGRSDEVIMIKDVAGTQVYWEEKEIFTLDALQPGVSYYIFTNAAFTVTYPECVGDYTLIWSDEFDGSEVKMEN